MWLSESASATAFHVPRTVADHHTSACVSIRQHTSAYERHGAPCITICRRSAYVSIRQHTSAYVSIRAPRRSMYRELSPDPLSCVSNCTCVPAKQVRCVPVAGTMAPSRSSTSAAAKREPRSDMGRIFVTSLASAYVSIRQHTSAYVSIRQHTSASSDVC